MHIPPNWGIFALLIVSFLAFWFIFKRLFFEPFLRVLAEREGRLGKLADRTEQLIREGKAAEAERERQLAAVRHERLAEREAERRKAEEEAFRMIADAKAEARASLDRLRHDFESELSAARQELERSGQTLAVELAGRLLGRSVDGGAPRN